MMTIEEEVALIIPVLRHPAGFDIDMGGILCIRPVHECSPPEYWEVDWEFLEDGMACKYHKVFDNLQEAATFFVEKRRYFCWGLDFDKILLERNKDD